MLNSTAKKYKMTVIKKIIIKTRKRCNENINSFEKGAGLTHFREFDNGHTE